jgi:hypothetical protein
MSAHPIFKRGDPVVFRVEKRGHAPGPRARDIEPEPMGDDYHYFVDKFWVVEAVTSDGRVAVRTRRGKRHIVTLTNRNMRHARWWEKILFKSRFPDLDNLPPNPTTIAPKRMTA